MPNRFSLWWNNISNSLKWVSLFFAVVGGMLIFISWLLQQMRLEIWSHLCVVIGSILALHAIESLVHHYALTQEVIDKTKKEFEKSVKTHMDSIAGGMVTAVTKGFTDSLTIGDLEQFSEKLINDIKTAAMTEFSAAVKQIAKDSIGTIKHFERIGLVNAFYRLDPVKTFKTVDNSHDASFVVLRIFFTDEEFGLLRNRLNHYIVTLKSKFKILLLNPEQTITIAQRLKFTGNNIGSEVKNCITKIETQLSILHEIRQTLPDDLKENLEIRVHESHLSIAMIGLGDTIIYSNYLQGCLSNEGAQLQVKEHTDHYHDLMQNFHIHWTSAKVCFPQPNGTFTFVDASSQKNID